MNDINDINDRTLVVATWRIDLPVVYYPCPACGAPRETSIGRWQNGGALQCLRCRAIYALPSAVPT